MGDNAKSEDESVDVLCGADIGDASVGFLLGAAKDRSKCYLEGDAPDWEWLPKSDVLLMLNCRGYRWRR